MLISPRRYRDLIFFNKVLSVGVTIPYLSLTLHAVQRTSNGVGIYMQLSLTPDISHTSNPDGNDDEELVELSVIPKGSNEASQPDVTEAIFKALSVCTSFHSATASNSDDEEDREDRILFEENGDEPRLQGFPGGGGWITAENVDQFRFEDADESNVILGPGAGSVRPRDAGEDAIVEDANSTDDSKWRRTG
jgi:nucleotide-sensitive chloride channel 1A